MTRLKKKADDALRPTQRWSGRIQADYWAFPHTSAGANAFENGDVNEPVADRFLFRRLRVGIQGQIPDNMLYKLEVDFNNPNNPQLKDNYIGWDNLPTLRTLLIGNQKRPYSLDQIHSTRFTIFIERPAIIEAFNQDSRRFGIQSYGYSEDLAYNWRYGAFKSQDIQNLGTVLATPIGDYQAEVAGRFARTWWDEASDGSTYAHTGIAGTVASTDPTAPANSTAHFQTRPEARTETRWLDTGVIAGANNYELLFGLEGVWNYGPLHVEGKYQHVWMQRHQPARFELRWRLYLCGLVPDRRTHGLGSPDGATGPRRAVHEFLSCPHDGRRDRRRLRHWQVAVRLSHADLSNLNVHGGISNEVTYSLIWYFNSHSKLIFNCITGDIRDRRPVDGQTAANFTILGTRLAVDF